MGHVKKVVKPVWENEGWHEQNDQELIKKISNTKESQATLKYYKQYSSWVQIGISGAFFKGLLKESRGGNFVKL